MDQTHNMNKITQKLLQEANKIPTTQQVESAIAPHVKAIATHIANKAIYILGGGAYGQNMNAKYDKMLKDANKWK